MTKALIYWEKATWTSPQELMKNLKKYYHTCLSFGIEFEIIDGDQSFEKSGYKNDFKVHSSISEALDDETLYVLLEPENSVPEGTRWCDLKDYNHPEEATYVIWSEYGTIPFDEFKNKECVSISAVENTCPLWSHVALGIVLYDRWSK